MNILFNTATNQVAGYTDYPDEFSALPDFVVCDIPDGWDESLRDAAEWVNGAIVINPAIHLSRMKSAKIDELSALRYQHETAGITLNGMTIETDRQPQSPELREKPRRLRRGGIAHRAKRGQTPVGLTLIFLCEYNRQYENRTANQVAPG